MNKSIFTFFVLLSLVMSFACADNTDEEILTDGDADNNSEQEAQELADGDGFIDGDIDDTEYEQELEEEIGKAFSFVVISDIHVRLPGKPDDQDYDNQNNLSNFDLAIERINIEESDAKFVAVTGDLVGCLFSEDTDDYNTGTENPAETFKTQMDELSMPYYAILGNHDYQNDYNTELGEGVSSENPEKIEAVWEKVLGIKAYYSHVVEGIRMIFLNSNRGEMRDIVCASEQAEAYCTGSFDDEQLTWLENELAMGDPSILFMHHPPITDSEDALFSFVDSFSVYAEDPFYDIVAQGKDVVMAIFTGHGHVFERDILFDQIPVYETCSIGDGNGHQDNMHIVEVDPANTQLNIIHGRGEDGGYWGEWK